MILSIVALLALAGAVPPTTARAASALPEIDPASVVVYADQVKIQFRVQ